MPRLGTQNHNQLHQGRHQHNIFHRTPFLSCQLWPVTSALLKNDHTIDKTYDTPLRPCQTPQNNNISRTHTPTHIASRLILTKPPLSHQRTPTRPTTHLTNQPLPNLLHGTEAFGGTYGQNPQPPPELPRQLGTHNPPPLVPEIGQPHLQARQGTTPTQPKDATVLHRLRHLHPLTNLNITEHPSGPIHNTTPAAQASPSEHFFDHHNVPLATQDHHNNHNHDAHQNSVQLEGKTHLLLLPRTHHRSRPTCTFRVIASPT